MSEIYYINLLNLLNANPNCEETIKTQFTSSIFVNINDKNPLDYHEKQYLLFDIMMKIS